ncbi:hypothetical protein DFAR_1470023 [Desulfarculales bacterium]
MNGHSHCGSDLGTLARWHQERTGMINLLLARVSDCARFG